MSESQGNEESNHAHTYTSLHTPHTNTSPPKDAHVPILVSAMQVDEDVWCAHAHSLTIHPMGTTSMAVTGNGHGHAMIGT